MLTKCDFLNKDTITLYSLNSDIAPLRVFDPSVDERTVTDRHKSQQPGSYATQSLRGGLEIHVEGDLFGDDAITYFSRRRDLITALFGDPNVPDVLTDRKYGTLILRFDGETEDWQTDVTITLFSAPINALEWARTIYAITFFSWTPYLIGAVSGDRYYLS